MGSPGYSGAARWDGYAAAEITAKVNDLAVINSDGNYEPGRVAEGLKCVGWFGCDVNTVGVAAGVAEVVVNLGTQFKRHRVKNGLDADKLTKVGETAYITGKRSVGKTATGRSEAGMVAGFDGEDKAYVLLYVRP
jgi:hypothetical protein